MVVCLFHISSVLVDIICCCSDANHVTRISANNVMSSVIVALQM